MNTEETASGPGKKITATLRIIHKSEQASCENSEIDYSIPVRLAIESENEYMGSPKPRRKRKWPDNSVSEAALKLMSKALHLLQERDENDCFGKFIASQLRSIEDPVELVKLKKKIMDTIYETQIKCLTE